MLNIKQKSLKDLLWRFSKIFQFEVFNDFPKLLHSQINIICSESGGRGEGKNFDSDITPP